ncbi:MAG: Co2+/Mg2+ efflux protein ApaG [Gammaproteobacteria bacterium]|nr:MAG: Co2+/Mg2+ efflux protein ApaG [Gammaproteobacteria bacterium]
MSAQQENHINVSVETTYLPQESSPERDRYVFAYTVTISNDGNAPAQLISRHWIITDSNNKVQEVRGDGVIGEQPYLKPGTAFRYTSGTVLETPYGTMEGSYQMVDDDGKEFDAPIPVFGLTLPGTLH